MANQPKILLLWLLVFLLLDIVTTALGLHLGLRELNPLVAALVRLAGLYGLLLSKMIAIALAGYFLYSGRLRLLRRVTFAMGAVVGWNVLWLLAR